MSEISKVVRKIEKLKPHRGDMILVRYQTGTPPEVLRRMCAYLGELATSTGSTILFIDNEREDLKLLNDEQMSQAGWIRKPIILTKGVV